LHLGATQGLVGLTLRLLRASPSVDFGGGDCCQKGGRHASVDRRRAQTLADWLVVLLAQVIANVLATALIAYGHLVSAFAAPGDAMKESRTVTWNAAGLVVQIFRPIVAQHGLDALEGFPAHIGWIFVLHDDPPFLARTELPLCPTAMPFGRTHPGPAIDEGTGIGRIFEHRRHCGNGRALPAGLSIAVPPQAEAALVERADHPYSRAALEEGIKHQCDAGLDLQVRGLRHNARGIPDEPDR